MQKGGTRGQAPADKLFFERGMLSLGAEYVAGADEAGRGPLAGPVVCAAVILPETGRRSRIAARAPLRQVSGKRRTLP